METTVVILIVACAFLVMSCLYEMVELFGRNTVIDNLRASNRDLLKSCRDMANHPHIFRTVSTTRACELCDSHDDRKIDDFEHDANCPVTLARYAIKRAEELGTSTEGTTDG